jgi:hypothetical protein
VNKKKALIENKKRSNIVIPTHPLEKSQTPKYPPLFYNEQVSHIPEYSTVDAVIGGVPKQNIKSKHKPGQKKTSESKYRNEENLINCLG